MPTLTISKASKANIIRRHNASLDARSRASSGAILIWLQRRARAHLRQVNERLASSGIDGLRSSKLVRKSYEPAPPILEPGIFADLSPTLEPVLKTKPDDLDEIERELYDLLSKYGLEEAREAGTDAANTAGLREWSIKPNLFRRINQELANKVVLIARDTEASVRDSLKRIIDDALEEKPTPTASEVGRRIARQWMGPPSDRVPLRGSTEEQRVTADWRRSQESIDAGGREYLFSYSRASTIAHTELGKIRTAAAAEAYTDAGVEEVEWLAYTDGRSGKRQHWKMNGKTITVEDMNSSDRSRWFRLPNGERARRPLDSSLSAFNTVRCRCILIPRISR